MEKRLQLERDKLNEKEHQELVKEGKRDPNAPYQEKKRQVRRDQFEASAENNLSNITPKANSQPQR